MSLLGRLCAGGGLGAWPGGALPALLTRYSSYKSAISLDTLHPGSSLRLTTPAHTGDPNEKFSGFIPVQRMDITYSASSGPGGQNVNKVHTKVDLRFRLKEADWLHPDIREKLTQELKNKITKDGYLIFKSDLTRSQQLNLADCLQKLRQVIRKAAEPERQPSPDTEERIRRRHEKAARERLMVKRISSQRRAERQPPTVLDL